MGERPDIGKMIEEELAKGGTPESTGDKPLEVRGSAIESGKETQRPPQASPEARSADQAAKKEIWEKERKALTDEYSRLHAERKERPKGPKDALTDAELDEFRAVIAQAAKENDKIATSVLKEGIAVADEATLHPYDKGLESLSDKLLEPNGDFYRQALMLMNSQPDGGEAMRALTRKLQERIETLAKATEQKKRLGMSRAETSAPGAAKEAAAKPREMSADEKRRAVSDAVKPFAEDVAKMLAGDKRRKEREAAEKKAANDDEEDKKPSFWDKLFGKKAA